MAPFSKVGRNPTNGSWWIVQAQPIRTPLLSKSHQRQLVDCSSPAFGSLATDRFKAEGWRRELLCLACIEAGLEQSTNCRWWDSEEVSFL